VGVKMLAKRIVPCLDVRNGKVVKGVNFTGIKEVDSPVELAKFYNKSGADELVFYDITATVEERGLFTDILKEVASQIFKLHIVVFVQAKNYTKSYSMTQN